MMCVSEKLLSTIDASIVAAIFPMIRSSMARSPMWLPGVPPPFATRTTVGKRAAINLSHRLSAEAPWAKAGQARRWVVPDDVKEQKQLNTLQTVVQILH